MEHFQAEPHQKLGEHKLSFESSTNEPKASFELPSSRESNFLQLQENLQDLYLIVT